MRKIRKIIVHCTDSDNPNVDIKEIRRWHVEERGWADIGYHAVIFRDGIPVQGRPDSVIGAHCEGHNFDSLGVAVHMRHVIFEEQVKGLKSYLVRKCLQYGVPASEIYPHNQFNPGKSCPNFDLTPIRNYVAVVLKEKNNGVS